MVKNLNEEKFERLFQRNRDDDRSIPDSNIWNRLQDKLDNHQSKKTKYLYRNWAIAASVLMLITTGFMFSMVWEKNNLNTFASNESASPINMEDLGSAEIHLTELSNIEILNNAYQILKRKSSPTEINY